MQEFAQEMVEVVLKMFGKDMVLSEVSQSIWVILLAAEGPDAGSRHASGGDGSEANPSASTEGCEFLHGIRHWICQFPVPKDGAESARPASNWIFFRGRSLTRVGRSKCLVSASAGFSAPGILSRWNSPLRSFSWTQRSLTARCLILPRPLRRQMPMAADASDLR